MSLPGFIFEPIALHRSGRTYVSHYAGSLEIAGRVGANLLTNCGGIWTDTKYDDANCGGCGTVCATGKTCCGGACVRLDNNCGGCGVACGQNRICCANDAGDYQCVNSQTDSSHCGACGVQCGIIASPLHTLTSSCCVNSTCLTTQNLATDPLHCGNCDTNCVLKYGSGWHCSAGHCCPNCTVWFDGYSDRDWAFLGGGAGTFLGGLTGGLAGWFIGKYLDSSIGPGCYSCETINEYSGLNLACCNGINCNTNLDNDPQHCGSCERNCTDRAYNKVCAKGRGGFPGCFCPPGFPDECPEACVNLSTGKGPDFSHVYCGKCGNVCPSGTVCCDGVCTDLINNRLHCGKCGNKCPTACCGTVCKDILSDHDNCWACGHRCNEGELCVAGECVKEFPVL